MNGKLSESGFSGFKDFPDEEKMITFEREAEERGAAEGVLLSAA